MESWLEFFRSRCCYWSKPDGGFARPADNSKRGPRLFGASSHERRRPKCFGPWIAESRILETNAWRLTDSVLSTAQREELQATIDLARQQPLSAGSSQRITVIAKQLNALVGGANNTIDSSAFNKLGYNAQAHASALMDRAFLLAGALIILIFVCAFTYRRFAP